MIICDTNIWYGIGSGVIKPESFSGEKLVCTFVSVHELSTSKNLYKNFNLVKKAVQAIKDHAAIFQMTNPVNYSLGKADPTGGNRYWLELQKVLSIEELIIPDEDVLMLDQEHDRMNAEYYDAIDKMNEIAATVRNNIRKNRLNKTRRKEDTTAVTKRLFLGFINAYVGQESVISENSIQWDNLNLVVHALSDFLKEIELTKQEIDPNDWHDIFNLVYVSKEDKYWTMEKQWNKIIGINPLTCNYLFCLS